MNLYKNAAAERLLNVLSNRQIRAQAKIGIIFNLANLDDVHKSEEQISIALNILRDQLQGCIGDIFSLNGGDIIVIFNGRNSSQINNAVYQMRYLFADDPLTYNAPGIANDNFCSVFDLESAWDNFYNACLMKTSSDSQNQSGDYLSSPELLNILLAGIERAIASITLEDFLYIENIFAINAFSDKSSTKAHPYKKVICQIGWLSSKLYRELKPRLDILSNKHLANFFDSVLEIRLLIKVLHIMKKPIEQAIMFKMSLVVLDSEEFEIFNNAIPENYKKNIIFAISIAEVFADLPKFQAIRIRMQSAGYKFCLDAVDQYLFRLIDREVLGFDLVQLRYDNSEKNLDQMSLLQDLNYKIQTSGSSRVILTDVNDAHALVLGKRLGILLYQGELLDLEK